MNFFIDKYFVEFSIILEEEHLIRKQKNLEDEEKDWSEEFKILISLKTSIF